MEEDLKIDDIIPNNSVICALCKLPVEEECAHVNCQYCEVLQHSSCILSCNKTKKRRLNYLNEWVCNECNHLNIVDDADDKFTTEIIALCKVDGKGCSNLTSPSSLTKNFNDFELHECRDDSNDASSSTDYSNKEQNYESPTIEQLDDCQYVENEKTNIRYVSLLIGTKTGKPKVYDSFGHGYSLRQMCKNYVRWQCIKCNGNYSCSVHLIQKDGNFQQNSEHNHSARSDNYIDALKCKAIEKSPAILSVSNINSSKKKLTSKPLKGRKVSSKARLKRSIVQATKKLKCKTKLSNKKTSVKQAKSNKQLPISKSTYVVVKGSTVDDEPELIDQIQGFKYRLFKTTERSKVWICSSSETYSKCEASVKQLGNIFVRTRSKHFHRINKNKVTGLKEHKSSIRQLRKKIVSQKLLNCANKNAIYKVATTSTSQNKEKVNSSEEKLLEYQPVDRIIALMTNTKANASDATELISTYDSNAAELKPIKRDSSELLSHTSESQANQSPGICKLVVSNNDSTDKVNVACDYESIMKGSEIPLPEEHCEALEKIFKSVVNTGFPVKPSIKYNASNLKNNKLFKLFIEGSKYYFDKQKLDIFPLTENRPPPIWIIQFLHKSSILSQRLVDLANMSFSTFSLDKLKWFYSSFERSLKETYRQDPHQYLDINNANRIFNFDSITLLINLLNYSENSKQVSHRAMTVLCCVNSKGQSIKPVIINKGKSVAKYDSNEVVHHQYNSINSLDGKLNSEIFHKWLLLFDEQLGEMGIRRPIILFLNGNNSCISYNSIQFAANKNIVLYHIPPNCGRMLNPLKASVFPLLKENFRKRFKRVLIRKKFPFVFIKSYEDINVVGLAMKGFRDSGLCPYNENLFDKKFKRRNISAVKCEILNQAEDLPLSSNIMSSLILDKNVMTETNPNFSPLKIALNNMDKDFKGDNESKATQNFLEPNKSSEIIGIKSVIKKCLENNVEGKMKVLDFGDDYPNFNEKNSLFLKRKCDSKLKKNKKIKKILPLDTILPDHDVVTKNIIYSTQHLEGISESITLSHEESSLSKVSLNREQNAAHLIENYSVNQNQNVNDSEVLNGFVETDAGILALQKPEGKTFANKMVPIFNKSDQGFQEYAGTCADVQNMSRSQRIGYKVALENMEDQFRGVVDPAILLLYNKKLETIEDYPDTAYLLWRGLQFLKKKIAVPK